MEATSAADRTFLSPDHSLRCLKCANIVMHLEQARRSEDRAPGRARLKELYRSNGLCLICVEKIHHNQYHELGDNLIEPHNLAGKVSTLPIKYGCPLCLLALQFKCKNNFLQPKNIVLSQNQRQNFDLLRGDFLFFSDSIDATTACYLPRLENQKHSINLKEDIRVVLRRKIHWPLVKSWLKICEMGHIGHCGQLLLDSKAPMISQRIFIDVEDQKIVTCRYDCRYIALSYVWGGVPQLLLTKANKGLLSQNGALGTFKNEIPQTIRDAMEVVRSVGEKLLWVDSLCIVQDDDVAKHDLISEMASIYDRALATIVAASGKNARTGLPGVSENSRMLESLVSIQGADLHIMNRTPLRLAMLNSTYNKRGWTFQERLLSRRCLYFTDTQVFFECQRHLYSEDRSEMTAEPLLFVGRELMSGNLLKKDIIDFGDPLASKEDRQLLRYSKIVNEYCGKQLTFADDILNAFSGIGTAIEHLSSWTLAYGLPEQLLDRAILWEQVTTTLLRSHILERPNSKFPTWSWLAWIGGVCYNEWTISDLQVFHSPLEIVSLSINTCTHQSKFNNHLKSSVLRFSSEYLSASIFPLKLEKFRNNQICFIVNGRGQYVGTIPGVNESFVEDYQSSSVTMVLLSASKLAVHRFALQMDMGYPSLFDFHPKSDWSVLTIMLVKWNTCCGNRMALGYIHRDAWREACPEVKPILLT